MIRRSRFSPFHERRSSMSSAQTGILMDILTLLLLPVLYLQFHFQQSIKIGFLTLFRFFMNKNFILSLFDIPLTLPWKWIWKKLCPFGRLSLSCHVYATKGGRLVKKQYNEPRIWILFKFWLWIRSENWEAYCAAVWSTTRPIINMCDLIYGYDPNKTYNQPL